VDDASRDDTAAIAARLGLSTFVHDANYGYGRNQTTCYREALKAGADVVVMVHPDYQYTPPLVTAMASMVAYGVYDVVIGSRNSRRHGAQRRHAALQVHFQSLADRMAEPLPRREAVRVSHRYRAFSRKVLETLPLLENSDDFVFDNEMLTQCVFFGFRIGEVSCPTKYFAEASSINFRRSVRYGLGVLGTTAKFFLQRRRWGRFRIFDEKGKRLILAVAADQAVSRTFAIGMAGAAWLAGAAIHWNNGYYNPRRCC
jgi:glycosyltransferase involved in cell wall biosynthesis